MGAVQMHPVPALKVVLARLAAGILGAGINFLHACSTSFSCCMVKGP